MNVALDNPNAAWPQPNASLRSETLRCHSEKMRARLKEVITKDSNAGGPQPIRAAARNLQKMRAPYAHHFESDSNNGRSFRSTIIPMAWLVLIVFDLFLVALACAQDNKPVESGVSRPAVAQLDGLNDVESGAVRFEAIDVYVDSGDEPLAAYQFELMSHEEGVEIVGIEGGEHVAFKDPPYYDAKAMKNNRVILAAFNTGEDLPAGRSRVARIHVQVQGPGQTEYQTKLTVSATIEGRKIPAKLSIAKARA